MLEPGTYSFYAGEAPGCVDDAPEVQLVHLATLTPIRGVRLNRTSRYVAVDVRGTFGWIATQDPDDSRLITTLSSDEPASECLDARIDPLGDEHWLVRTDVFWSVVDLTMSRVRRLGAVSGPLTGCRAERATVVCRGPEGLVRFDREGVVLRGDYEPTWQAELEPE